MVPPCSTMESTTRIDVEREGAVLDAELVLRVRSGLGGAESE